MEVGVKYQLVGWQMIKDENAELIINGKRVENDYTFTADSEHMEVQEPTPETPHTPSDSPKTGDRTNVGLFMGLFALSSVGLAGTLYLKKRKTKKS